MTRRLVDNDAMQPGSRRRLTAETIADLVRGDVPLLGHVRRERRTADYPQCRAIRVVIGPLVEGAEVRDLEAECHRIADGFERHIGTNHLGHFALTNLLSPHITGRVVTVSSHLHSSGRLDLEDLNWKTRPYRPGQAYSDSKLANILFTLELQRRLTAAGTGVRALAVHPGMTRTTLFSHATASRRA